MREASGSYSVALGIDTKVVASGKCNHPTKRFIDEKYVYGLPIPEFAWTHCIFCFRDETCNFAGKCEYKEEFDNA